MATIAQADLAQRVIGWLLPSELRSSALLLTAANLLPLYGVLVWDWPVFHLMALYWAENVLAGVVTLLRMLRANPIAGIFMGAFFSFHYGMFCFVHGVFVYALFSGDTQAGVGVDQLAWTLLATPSLLPAVALMAASHFWSFIAHGLGPRDEAKLGDIMLRPYGRMVVLHVTIIAAGFFMVSAGAPEFVLVPLILFKTVTDLALHRRANLPKPVVGQAPESEPQRPLTPEEQVAQAYGREPFQPSVPLSELTDAPDVPATGARPFQINSGRE